MNNEKVVEEIVTMFLLKTCRLRQQLTKPAVQATDLCATLAAMHNPFVPLTTGSVAEFYIEPMIAHIGDIDVMCCYNDLLAIPAGQTPPNQLPVEFRKYVLVYDIIDSHFPGYVYLTLRYMLTECVDDGKYNAMTFNRQRYLQHGYNMFGRNMTHGPAMLLAELKGSSLLSIDIVFCMRCLVWPPQATEWSTRHRKYDWPDSATVDRVISSGCDLVGVAHRQCRQHEWTGKHQFRLSFSRAEILLLNSWMPVQQIIYHMLRVFIKAERLTDSNDVSGAGKLSNYHIKTLMMWASELKPRSWWTDDLNLVRICVKLLHNLAVWLSESQCPQYFITNCNLIENTPKLMAIAAIRLMSISRSWLSLWFVNNYIRECSLLCPRIVSRLFDDNITITNLQIAVSAIIVYREQTALYDEWRIFRLAQSYIHAYFFTVNSLTVRSLDWWLNNLPGINTSLAVYFQSFTYLHIARRASRSRLTNELMDVLAKVVGLQFVGSQRHSNPRTSGSCLSKAVKLMKLVANKAHNTLKMIQLELSKAYLYRLLSCEDSDSDSNYCLAHVYLAALYYTTGQYQTSIDHCTVVTRSQDHSQCSSCVVEGKSLPKIDDDIDIVLGLTTLYQHVRTVTLIHQQMKQDIAVFATEPFAHFLSVKCVRTKNYEQLNESVRPQTSTCHVHSNCYVKSITDKEQPFIADVLLCKLLCDYSEQGQLHIGNSFVDVNIRPNSCSAELNTSQLVALLQQYAVEKLTLSRQIEARDFSSVVVTTDFEALYAYKCGGIQQCLELSTQNVRTLLHEVNGPHIVLFPQPELIQLLEDDIVSLTALMLILNTKCIRANIRNLCITQLTLSLYLMTQCQLKLRHSVTSLAQTLDYIEVAQRSNPVDHTLDHLILRLTARIALRRFE